MNPKDQVKELTTEKESRSFVDSKSQDNNGKQLILPLFEPIVSLLPYDIASEANVTKPISKYFDF